MDSSVADDVKYQANSHDDCTKICSTSEAVAIIMDRLTALMDRQMSDVEDETYPCNKCFRRYTGLEFLLIHKSLVHGDTNLEHLKNEEPTDLSSTSKSGKVADHQNKSVTRMAENDESTINDIEVSNDKESSGDVAAGNDNENKCVTMPHSDSIKKEPIEDLSHVNEISGVGSTNGSFELQENGTRPVKRNKSNLSGLYTCRICCLIFYERKQLKKHRQTHLPEKPYKCDVCDSAFYESSKLKVHRRIHTGEKPFKCEFCGMAFTQWSNLQTHRRSHTGERPYKCDVCKASFGDSGKLKMHQRVHTGEKPYNCDICGVWFSQNGHLQRHRKIHTGEKPYKCDVCEVSFSDGGRLKTHQKTHTAETTVQV